MRELHPSRPDIAKAPVPFQKSGESSIQRDAGLPSQCMSTSSQFTIAIYSILLSHAATMQQPDIYYLLPRPAPQLLSIFVFVTIPMLCCHVHPMFRVAGLCFN